MKISLIIFFLLTKSVKAAEKVVVPNLEVKIPGLDFKQYPVYQYGTDLYIPWIGAYISAVYNYLLGISIIAAAVMIVYGGFRYILSSTTGATTAAKDIIKNALIGLCLMFGLYAIVSVINEPLLTLKTLKVPLVRGEPLNSDSYSMIATSITKVSTSEGIPTTPTPNSIPPQIAPSGEEKISSSALTDAPISTTPVSADCPLNLPKEDLKRTRVKTFNSEIRQYITGTTFSERVIQVANFMVNCKMRYSNCNEVSQFVWLLSGAGDYEKCQDMKKRNVPNASYGPECHPHDATKKNPYKRDLFDFFDSNFINGLFCPNDCEKEAYIYVDPISKEPSQALLKAARRSDCKRSKGEAMAAVKERITQKAGKDYDELINQMELGDYYATYTANKSCASSHSVVFIAWKSPGWAISIQGDVNNDVSFKTYCLSPKCAGQAFGWAPVLRISRPIIK